MTAKTPNKEKKSRNRKAPPKPPREPTDMTEERKAQLQEIAEKARAARAAKRLAKEAARETKGAKFRERIDAAREKRRDEPSTPVAKAGVKRKSEVVTSGIASAAKRSRRRDT
jgi:transposase